MIKWVHLTACARSEHDFHLLTRMLSALGLKSGEAEQHSNLRVQPFFPSIAAVEVQYQKNSAERADLDLTISDPESAAEILKGMGLEIEHGDSGPDPNIRSFRVRCPGGTTVAFTGFLNSRLGGFEPEGVTGNLQARGKCFALIASRFNSFIVERLLTGALEALNLCGADQEDLSIVRVPGAFEIPSAARTLAEIKKYDAIICLGCLLRGDTAHYDVIVNEVTRGIGQSAQETGVPHAFGVLTCDTLEQAIDRAGLKMGNKGFEAALAAVEMANLKNTVAGRPSLVISKNKSQKRTRPSVTRKSKK